MKEKRTQKLGWQVHMYWTILFDPVARYKKNERAEQSKINNNEERGKKYYKSRQFSGWIPTFSMGNI